MPCSYRAIDEQDEFLTTFIARQRDHIQNKRDPEDNVLSTLPPMLCSRGEIFARKWFLEATKKWLNLGK